MKYIWILLLTAFAASAQTNQERVFVFDIKTDIDPRTDRYVKLAFEEADEINADAILIHMDTYGGQLDAADNIRKRVLAYKKPVYVFIDKNAASAGALISLACDSIYMATGGNIGAATVVNGNDGQPVPEKYQSYMRSLMRSTAEANNRNPDVAEAMVGTSTALDTLKAEGEVLTLTTTEALKIGFCEGRAETIDEALAHAGISDYELTTFELSATEKIISMFLNPFLSGILMMIIIGGVYFELQSPGIGFPILAAFVAALLYFIPHYLNGLADYWELALLFVGIALMAAEFFIIPGFGIAGISGIAITLASLVLMMLNNTWFDFGMVPERSITQSLIALAISITGGAALVIFGSISLVNSRYFDRVALTRTQDKNMGYISSPADQLLLTGRRGLAATPLMPGGKVIIDDISYDAVAKNGYIEKGEAIEVLGRSIGSLQVKPAEKNELV